MEGHKRAIIYVAWGQRHVEEAAASANSTAFMGIDRLLITDRASSHHIPSQNAFEQVILHEFKLAGQLAKTEMFALLPQEYNSFVFLDSDTHVLLDITQGFSKAELHGVALSPATAYSLEHFWGFGDILTEYGIASSDLLLYNSGVLFFTRADAAWKVMRKWHELCTTSFGDVAAWGDQPYLTVAMELLDFNPYTLSIGYNYRNFGELVSGKVRIWHSRTAPPEDVNDFASPWPLRRFIRSNRLNDSA